jgi:hypothetical protein
VKTYTMRSSNRWFGLWLPNLLLFGMFLYGLVHIVGYGFNKWYLMLVVVPLVFLLSSVRGLHQPNQVVIGEDEVVFSAFGRTHTYRISDLTFLHVRRFSYVKQALVRIGPPKIIGGRYWIDSRFPEYDELMRHFDRFEQTVCARQPAQINKVRRGSAT